VVVELTLEQWFRQDGANVLTARTFKEVIREEYPDHVISLRGELPRPPQSPDLSASDHFLWGYLKAKVYTIKPWTIDNLKIAIRKQISGIPENMMRQELGDCKQGCSSVYAMMANILVMCCSIRNHQRERKILYVE
jgi:hypothetical protein